MNHSRLLLVAALLPAFSACNLKTGSTTTSAALTAAPVATVNGTPIGQQYFDFYVKTITGRASSDLTPEARGQALENMIRFELLAQQAEKEGLDKNADTASAVELSRLRVLQAAVIDKEVKKPTEQEMRAEYETAVATYPKVEYHARHILVATESFAQGIIQRLDKGEKFEEVAKQESMDPSKSNGGDIGWFTLNSIDQTLGDAVSNLKPASYTHTPVHSQYGWHVVQLVETRDTTPPPYERARGSIEQMVENKKIKAYTDELMRGAKIDKTLDDKAKSSAPATPASSAAPAADKKG
jgi:peptidyl-prolyl cis-trans isomerase C